MEVDADVVRDAAVDERFLHALVAVHEVRVLPDDRDAHALVRLEHAMRPSRSNRRAPAPALDAELLQHLLVESLLVERERDLVDRADVRALDHGAEFDVAEERDLALDVVGDRAARCGR